MITYRQFKEISENYSPKKYYSSDSTFVIYKKSKKEKLATADSYEQAKKKANDVRQQKGLKFDDVSFMTARRFSPNQQQKRMKGRIEVSPIYNRSKGTYFKGIHYPDGSYADLD